MKRSDEALVLQFRLLRAQIETRLPAPAAIAVTSASEHDGKTATAYGLAEAFVAAGYSTAIVNAGEGTSSNASVEIRSISIPHAAAEIPLKLGVANRTDRLDEIIMPTRATGFFSRDVIQMIVNELRENYDYTVIDTTRLLKSDLALLLTGAASATLIAARLGRPRAAEDRRMMAALESVDANVLGVVAVSEKTIANFVRSESSARKALPEAGRQQTRLQSASVADAPHPGIAGSRG